MKTQTTEFLFIDANVADKQTLIDSAAANIKVVELSDKTDALSQIAAALKGFKNLDAIHIISHGAEGELAFAGGTLNSENLSSYKLQLKKIGASLSKDGDILLYGCDVAGGETGSAFIHSLAKLTKADVAASIDLTGASAKGGDWVLEKQTGNIEAQTLVSNAYGEILTDLSTPTYLSFENPPMYPGKTAGEFRNSGAFAVIKSDGSVVTWGDSNSGGNSSAVATELNGENNAKDVVQIYSTQNAFAALRKDGSVITWGWGAAGGNSTAVANEINGTDDTKDVVQIYSTTRAFAALRKDGSVVTWGHIDEGGNSSSVASSINGTDDAKDVVQIYSTLGAFAALRKDGSVITWGNNSSGGDSATVATALNGAKDALDVVSISSTDSAFAALRKDGSVVTWGDNYKGGDSSTVAKALNGNTKVVQVYSTRSAFAALRTDGSVITWGGNAYGGDSTAVATEINGKVNTKDVVQIYSSVLAFAALRKDGSVVTWGVSSVGGDSSSVAIAINGTDDTKDVVQIYSTTGAFAALRKDGSVVTWGDTIRGGDSSAVANELNGTDDTKDVVQIYSTLSAFAALRKDGSVITWGNSLSGGDSSAIAANLKDVVQIYSIDNAFAALRKDGSMVTWGNSSVGGDSSEVADKLTSNVINAADIHSDAFFNAVPSTPLASSGRTSGEWRNSSAFAVIKSDGSVAAWGSPSYGGSSGGNLVISGSSNTNISPAEINGTDDTKDAVQIYSTQGAFAALRKDGSVLTWGWYLSGGDSSTVATALNGTNDAQDVVQIYSTKSAFAALRKDGSVVTWGNATNGGDSSAVATALNGLNDTQDVVQIYSTDTAFAALRKDGSVVTWGYYYNGANSTGVASAINGAVDEKDVVQIYSTHGAFAALRKDGSVVTWGDQDQGGDSTTVGNRYSPTSNTLFAITNVATALNGTDNTKDVVQIYSTQDAFAALRKDGSVVTWGIVSRGGDSSSVASALNGSIDAQDVVQVYSTSQAFAALRKDGSVITWGRTDFGSDSSSVASALNGTNDAQDVVQIYSTIGAFAALRKDGSVVTWGHVDYGGDSSKVAVDLNGNDNTKDIVQIYATDSAFAALRKDGSVIAWGNQGGSIPSDLKKNLDGTNNAKDVVQIYSTEKAFAALHKDGSISAWGNSLNGSASSTANSPLTNVVNVADISNNEFYYAKPNVAPTFTSISALQGTEDTSISSHFNALKFASNAADSDGTITSFVVKEVQSGKLTIDNKAFAAGTNDTISSSSASFWTPPANNNGNINAFTMVAKDDGGKESATPVQVVVDVAPVNDPPTLTRMNTFAFTPSIPGSQSMRFSYADLLAASDARDLEGDPISFYIQPGSSTGVIIKDGFSVSFGTVINAGESFSWTTTRQGATVIAFLIKAQDANDGSVVSSSNIPVKVSVPAPPPPPPPPPMPQAPTFVGGVNAGLTILEDASITTISNSILKVVDAEQSAAQLVYRVGSLPTKGTLTINNVAAQLFSTFTQADVDNNLIKFTPTANANGYDNFFFSVSDGAGGNLIAQTFNITITSVNDLPTANDDIATAREAGGNNNSDYATPTTGNVLTNDVDIDNTLTVSAIRTGNTENSGTAGTVGQALAGTYGSLTLNANGSYSYAVDNANSTVAALKTGDTLTESFNYTASDGTATDTAVLTITIEGTNDLPATTNLHGDAADFWLGSTTKIALDIDQNMTIIDPDSVNYDGGNLSVGFGQSNLGTGSFTVDGTNFLAASYADGYEQNRLLGFVGKPIDQVNDDVLTPGENVGYVTSAPIMTLGVQTGTKYTFNAIGSVTTSDTKGFSIALNAKATPEQVQKFIRNLYYLENLDDTTGAGARTIDVQLNEAGATTTPATVTLTKKIPAITTTLNSDTGVSNSDFFTKEANFTVANLLANVSVTWQYSSDAGKTWFDGTGTTFSLVGDGEKTVVVRQLDAAKKTSANSTPIVLTLDTTSPDVPKLHLTTDTGDTFFDDFITKQSEITVSNIETGASWRYSLDNGSNWITGGAVSDNESTITGITGDGEKSILVEQTDKAGNVSLSSKPFVFTLDTTAAVPTIAFAENTGDTNDTITKNGTLNVSGLEIGASWKYSTDNAQTWTNGVGSSFTLTGDGAKSVIVSQTDLAGNVSANSSAFNFTLDTTAATPTLAITDTGASSTDNITKTGTVTVSGLESHATWEYSLDEGSTWTNGTGTTYAFTGDGAKSFTVRQSDVAANVSSNAVLKFTLDTTIATPTLALSVDTNLTDNVTSNGKIVVTGLESSATWEYQIGGGSWITGSGESFVLTSDGANQSIVVKQTDAAGNSATSNPLVVTLDSSIATPTISLATDTGRNGDKITSDSTLNVANLETGATWKYSLDAGQHWSDGTGSTITDITGDGQKTVVVRQSDLAGNVATSAAFTFTLNSASATKPSLALAVDTGAADSITNNGTVNVTGLESGATWQYSVDNGSNWLNGSGSSFTLTGDGAKSVVVKQVNMAGSESVSSDALSFTLDTTVATPTIALTDDTGTSNADRLTKNSEVTVSGLEAQATWEYKIDSGNWTNGTGSTIPASEIIGDGDKTVLVRQTDKAGNVSNNAQLNFTLVTVNDAASGITLATDSGSSANDGITNTRVLNVSGVSNTSFWEYSLDSGTTWSGWVAQTTSTSFTLTGDGKKSVVIHQKDNADNVGQNSTPFTFILDTTVSAPTLSFIDSETTNDGITNNPVISVSGLENGATWEYKIDSGNWTNGVGQNFTLTTDGAKSIVVRQTDAAGNTSVSSSALTLTLDTAVAAPSLALTNDTGINGGDLLTKDGSITVSGLETGATWRYSLDNASTWSAWLAASTNTFELTGEGKKSVIAEQKDFAGNTSTISSSLNFEIDTSVTTPTLAFTDSATNDDAITNDGKVTVSGLENGASWEYSVNNGNSWTAGSGNHFILTGDGQKSVVVRQTDLAGNTSSVSSTTTFTLDTTVAMPNVALIDDTNVGNDKITRSGGLSVSALETGASWQYQINADNWAAGAAVTVNAGTISTPISDGLYLISVKQTDVAGNSSLVNAFNFTLDTTVATPTLALAADTGNGSDNITKNGKILVSNLENGASWKYSLDNGENWTTGSGSEFTLTGDGAKSVIVSQTDLAGNTANSGTFTFTLDTQAIAPTLLLTDDTGEKSFDFITSNASVDISGLETGATWEYSLDGSNWTTGTGTNYTFAGGDGAKTIRVRQTDVAGNQSVSSVALNFTLDTTTTKPTASFVDTGTQGDGLTKNGTVTVANIETGAKWEYSNDQYNWILGTGNSFTLTQDGNKTIYVRTTDLAGNTQTSDVLTFKLDAKAATPFLMLENDSGQNNFDFVTSSGVVNVGNLEDGTWQYSLDDGKTWINGSDSSFTISDIGTHSIIAKQIDASDNVSGISAPFVFTLEGTPTPVTVALTEDTNVGNDRITSNGEITVSGVVANATVQYSFDNGESWENSSSNTIEILDDGAKSLLVRQMALSGLTSTNTAFDFVLDTQIGKPTLSLDRASGVISIVNLESHATWQYTIDAGETWTTGTGTELTLSGTEQRFVVVKQTDLAGNVSLSSDELAFPPLNTAPTISNVPNTAQSVTTGVTAQLPDFTVDDVDGGNLTVTLTSTNGTIRNLVDNDTVASGIQISGTIAEINTRLAAATFTANSAGNASIQISVTDGIVQSPTTASYNLTATNPPPPPPSSDPIPPAPVVEPPKTSEIQQPTQNTKPILPELELQVTPAKNTGIIGDGNGDGIPDIEQKNVISLPTQKDLHDAENAPKVFLSIELPQGLILTRAVVNPVTDSTKEKPITFTTETVNDKGEKVVGTVELNNEVAPFGLFEFDFAGVPSTIDANGNVKGGTADVKLYLDDNQTVEKYLKQTISGAWKPIPFSYAYDEKLGKTVVSISLTDGDEFDLDGGINGSISDPGTPIILPKLTVSSEPEPVSVQVLPQPLTKVFVGYDRAFILDSGAAKFYGQGEREVVELGANASNVIVDQNIEHVKFTGVQSDYSFEQKGNSLQVAKGSTMIAQITVQDDANGSLLTFENGTQSAQFNAGKIELSQYTLVIDDIPRSIYHTGKIFTAQGETIGINSELANVYGSSGYDVIALAENATKITIDQNVEQVNFAGNFVDYRFALAGNSLDVFVGTTQIANINVQDDNDGIKLIFADSEHFAKFVAPTTDVPLSIEITGVATPF